MIATKVKRLRKADKLFELLPIEVANSFIALMKSSKSYYKLEDVPFTVLKRESDRITYDMLLDMFCNINSVGKAICSATGTLFSYNVDSQPYRNKFAIWIPFNPDTGEYNTMTIFQIY